jgi:hypothetical protein
MEDLKESAIVKASYGCDLGLIQRLILRRVRRSPLLPGGVILMNGAAPSPPLAWPKSRAPRFGIQIPPQDITWAEVAAIVREAEDLGYDTAWVFDHFFPILSNPEGPCLEGWTLLSGLTT